VGIVTITFMVMVMKRLNVIASGLEVRILGRATKLGVLGKISKRWKDL